jgi:hypothetical protein
MLIIGAQFPIQPTASPLIRTVVIPTTRLTFHRSERSKQVSNIHTTQPSRKERIFTFTFCLFAFVLFSGDGVPIRSGRCIPPQPAPQTYMKKRLRSFEECFEMLLAYLLTAYLLCDCGVMEWKINYELFIKV